MDTEKFINLVCGHKCLWDQSDSTYHLRDHQRKAWQEISEEIKVPVDELKKKWRGLRDTFGKELKKVKNKKSGQAADTEPESKWPYFKLLLFLQGTMSRRDLKGSMPDICETSETEDRCDERADCASTSSDYHPSPASSQFVEQNDEHTPKKIFKSPLKRKLKRNPPDEIDTKLLETEQEKLKLFQQTANDPDAQFLMSLLPFLKDIPKHRKLIVRSRLQEVLIHEQYGISSAAQLDYSSDSTQCSDNNSMPQINLTHTQQSTSIVSQQLSDSNNLTEYVMQFNPN